MKYICLNLKLFIMENQPVPSKNVILNYGLYLGIASILVSVILYALGMHYDQDWKQGTFGFIIMVAIIFLGLKKYKELNNGYLTIGQALKTGVGIALIGGIISLIYSYVFMNFIEPDFMANIMAGAEEKMIEQNPNLTDEQIEQALAISSKMSSPVILASISIFVSLFFGFIVSLITGLILKNNPEN